ncbi:MAG: hypothetical protein OEU26_28270, partial [Candidatus Tectomicrobia bacterium]|nr:hypothetical protein [Candidatus Tectomicrobia bacterium]
PGVAQSPFPEADTRGAALKLRLNFPAFRSKFRGPITPTSRQQDLDAEGRPVSSQRCSLSLPISISI